MVEIKKIKKGKKEYFYLVHSYREGKSVKKKQFYLSNKPNPKANLFGLTERLQRATPYFNTSA